MTPFAPFARHFDLGGDRVRPALDVDEGVLGDAGHAFVQGERLAVADQVRPARDRGVEPLRAAVVQREDVVLDRFLGEQVLQLLELLRVLRGEVVRLAEVLGDVDRAPSGPR